MLKSLEQPAASRTQRLSVNALPESLWLIHRACCLHCHRRTTERPLCIYIDVDGTLVQTTAGRRVPNQSLLCRLREWKAQGAILYCWSSGGADYAQRTAEELKVKACFAAFLTKPHALVDDQSIQHWPYFLELAPARAEGLSVTGIREELEGL